MNRCVAVLFAAALSATLAAPATAQTAGGEGQDRRPEDE